LPELEIHHHVEHADPAGQRVGVQAAIIAIFLAVVSIAAHRAHTHATVLMTSSADKWAFFQSRRNRFYNAELKSELVAALAPDAPGSKQVMARAADQMKKATEETEQARKEAQEVEQAARHEEEVALRYDIGEGLLEIGLVTSSLYFIARRRIFPLMGIVAAIAGIAVAVTTLFMH
jgi:hypothetical protein